MLATHVGSLPRPRDLLATLLEKEEGGAVDEEALGARVGEAVTEVVGLQRDRGIDVVNDGEVGKTELPRLRQRPSRRLRARSPTAPATRGASRGRRATSPSSTSPP